MIQLLTLDSASAVAAGSAAAPLVTGLFVYAIATTAYILIGLRFGEHDTPSHDSEPREDSSC